MNKEEKKDIFLYAKLIFIGALCVFAFLAILFKYFPDTVEKVESSQEVSFMEEEPQIDAPQQTYKEEWEEWEEKHKGEEYVQPFSFYIKNGYLYLQTMTTENRLFKTSKIGRVQND